MKKRIIALVMCIACAVLAAMPALAADPIDTGKSASLEIKFQPDEVTPSDITFKAYKVASVDAYTNLTLTGDFSEFSLDLSKPDADLWNSAVPLLESYIAENSIEADYTAKTDAEGVAKFDGMSVGLYFVTGENFVINHDVYIPESYLVMLPERNSEGQWDYSVEAQPKYTKTDELVDVTVRKKWVGAGKDAPESITVTLYCDEAEYETVILSAENKWTYVWEDLNAKNKWTVSETAVEGYNTTLEEDGWVFIITNTSKIITQTGQLWWPIPLLVLAGGAFCLCGVMLMRKHRNEA